MSESLEKKKKKKSWGLDLQIKCNFSTFFGQTEAIARRARERVTRERRRKPEKKVKNKNKKATKKHLYPYVHQDRKTTKNILRIVNS